MTYIHENKTFLNSTFAQTFFHLAGDVYKRAPGWHIEPEFFSVGFHIWFPENIYLHFILPHAMFGTRQGDQ